jgi:hypothetical protein
MEAIVRHNIVGGVGAFADGSEAMIGRLFSFR